MLTVEDPMQFLRMLKGAPACLMWALVFSGRFMTGKELQLWTGYADDSVTKGLDFLVRIGWVTEKTSHGPWRLAEGVQLPLMQGCEEIYENSENIGIPGSSSSRSLNIDTQDKDIKLLLLPDDTIPLFPESAKLLKAGGIYDPVATELANLSYGTPGYVQGHIDLAKRQGRDVAVVVYRIRNHWPLESAVELDDEDDPHRYVRGRYAEFVNRDDDEQEAEQEQDSPAAAQPDHEGTDA